MGIRLILLAVALWLLFTIIRRLKKQRSKDTNKTQASHSVDMVACHRCGVHLPQNEAICLDGHYYCCDKHAKPGGNEE